MQTHAKHYRENTPQWYDNTRARAIVDAYNAGAGSGQAADPFVAASLVPAATGSFRDFSYIAPDLPFYNAENCVACMECVQNCPDAAIWGKVITEETLVAELGRIPSEQDRELIRLQLAKTTKFFDTYQKRRLKNPEGPPGAWFGIFVDPTKCKGCGECVTACGGHAALSMIKKTKDKLPDNFTIWDFFKSAPPTPLEYIDKRLKVDILLKEEANQYVGGGGSCMGCGEASVIRQLLAMTYDIVGSKYGIVAATGCNTVYGSTYPYNPYRAPWANSLFENAPTVAMGIRTYWDQMGMQDHALWVFGGDGAMLDIGFQALSRMMASGMNIKAVVLDTQVYSNTGGQASTATFMGQNAKMSAHGKTIFGKTEGRKEIANIAIMHPRTFVAQTVGPMINHFYRAIERALLFDGPALINVYTTCQPEHQVADDQSCNRAVMAVESRAFPVFIYDPDAGPTMASRLDLRGNPSLHRDWHMCKSQGQSSETRCYDFVEFARSEGRFAKQFGKDGSPSESLLKSQEDRLANWRLLQQLAGLRNEDMGAIRSESEVLGEACAEAVQAIMDRGGASGNSGTQALGQAFKSIAGDDSEEKSSAYQALEEALNRVIGNANRAG